METALRFQIQRYTEILIILYLWYVCWEDIHISTRHVVLINTVNGSTGLLGSIFMSEYIRHNTYTHRRISFSSKPTPIHGPVNKPDLFIHN